MAGVYWGSRQIVFGTGTGDATQLFPAGVPATTATNTYPPAATGKVKRPCHGMIDHINFESDGVNGGYVELWDVEGLDRDDSAGLNNVNDGDRLKDAFLTSFGTLIDVIEIKPSGGAGHPFGGQVSKIPFNKGLAVRFVAAAGAVNVAPYVEGGFMVSMVVQA